MLVGLNNAKSLLELLVLPLPITNIEVEDTDNSVKLIKSVNYLELIPILIVKMKNIGMKIHKKVYF